MKLNLSNFKASVFLSAVALVAMGTPNRGRAAIPTPLQGSIALRPLTPQEKKDYSLPNAQGASGLDTIGVGQPAYLEALVNIDIPAASITGVTWALTEKPMTSAAALTESPLGANVPTYKMIDREICQVAGRKLLSPDVTGQYVVTATITSAGETNVVTKTITAGNYVGVNTCALCHSGGQIAENTVVPWSETAHATFFTRAIDGLESDHYGKNCISCHTVGYDVNTNAVNGGFDDVATKLGWTFPTNVTSGNWAALPAGLKNLSNIQCENCHGPGSEHAYSLGDTNKISATFAVGDCAQCHDSKPNHVRSAEWNNSRHAVSVEETEAGCVRCHTPKGFANFVAGKPAVATEWEAISCAGCHDPHDATKPHQLRNVSEVKLMDKKTVITEGGAGLLCMDCHMTRRDATNYVEITAGSSRFGPHHGPQADMLVGANAITYGKNIPSSAHRDVVEDSCAACHMQSVASTNAAFTHVGGHTFSTTWEGGTNGPVHLTGACIQCHGDVESFDFQRQDYDGDGVVDGVQTEVKHLLNKLAMLLPPVGQPTVTITTNYTKPQLKAVYNYQFVLEDGSFGVHNLSYAVGLLKASIADLSGDANTDGLPDSWQIQYFGSANDPKAAPNAAPAGDGVPNWLKYSLGLDPMVAGAVVPEGVVWANGKTLTNPPIDPNNTNSVAIYTAAEVVFNTELGKNYQIQASSSLSEGWKNVGDVLPGTGAPISYVTPTRTKVQQFYRVEMK
jgi:hypothetical protein